MDKLHFCNKTNNLKSNENGGKTSSLLSVNTSDRYAYRGSSPNNFDCRLCSRRWDSIQESLYLDKSTDIIKEVATLSLATGGLVKSFSTADITFISHENLYQQHSPLKYTRNAVSEIFLNSTQYSDYFLNRSRLENVSRSCSTWVTVGDIPSTSQLPSPHSHHSLKHSSKISDNSFKNTQLPFTAIDFIYCVNKKVRQYYVKRKLITAYKALKCVSQSDFNLNKLNFPSTISNENIRPEQHSDNATHASTTEGDTSENFFLRISRRDLPLLTVNDVDREKGQPLSRYDRNMMIFNWLLTLDISKDDTVEIPT